MGESTRSLLHHQHQEDDDHGGIIPAQIHRISLEQEQTQLDQEDDNEMALSLCDLPLDNSDKELASPTTSSHMNIHRRSTTQPQENFEFFSDLSSEMSSAEGMILCGRLVPFKETLPPSPLPPVMESSETRMVPLIHRRSGSLPRSKSATKKSISSNKSLMRSSRSLDYRNLNRGLSNLSSCSSSSSSNSLQEHVHDGASTARSIVGESSFKSKPGWFFFMFGLAKPPSYGPMELKDIKFRQSRRNPPTMFLPAEDDGGSRSAVPGKGYSCRLLRVLSCKNHASVAVETSLYDMPYGQ